MTRDDNANRNAGRTARAQEAHAAQTPQAAQTPPPAQTSQTAQAAGFERSQIAAAAARIAGHVRRTPVIDVRIADRPGGSTREVNLKLEYLQVSGTFKARGAFNRLLSAPAEALARGVVTASGGNHGIAVATAARELGVPAHVFIPSVSSAAKRERLVRLGAHLEVIDGQYADALAASEAFLARTGALRSHAYDQPETLAGQGTVALEWLEQASDLDTVLVAVGGGGLVGGMAAWLEGRVRVVAVESETCATLHSALSAGRPVEVDVSGLAADSLGARQVGELMFPIARRAIERCVLVSDDAIREAQRWLWRELRVPAEPGGAAAFAALRAGAYVPARDERVGVLVCGANVDPATLA